MKENEVYYIGEIGSYPLTPDKPYAVIIETRYSYWIINDLGEKTFYNKKFFVIKSLWRLKRLNDLGINSI